MASTLEISDGKGIIKFNGALTVNCAEEIRMLLIKALIDADQVLMDFGDVTAADLSSFQLICSAHRTAVRLKKQLSYAGTPPDVFIRSVEEGGFARATGCGLDCEKSCLWMMGAAIGAQKIG